MKKLSVREVDQKICELISVINAKSKLGIAPTKKRVEIWIKDLGLHEMTLWRRIQYNQAFGLQYDKNAKVYYVNTDKPKTLESISQKVAEPSTKPKTFTSNERIEYNQSVVNERLHYVNERLDAIEKRIDENNNIYNGNVKKLNEVQKECEKVVDVFSESIEESDKAYKILNERLTNNVDRIQDNLTELKVKTNELKGEQIMHVKILDRLQAYIYNSTFFQRLRWLFTGGVND